MGVRDRIMECYEARNQEKWKSCKNPVYPGTLYVLRCVYSHILRNKGIAIWVEVQRYLGTQVSTFRIRKLWLTFTHSDWLTAQ